MTKKKQEPQKQVVFKLPEIVEFPQVIFPEAENIEQVREMIAKSGFVAVQQKNVIANRVMDAEEISEIRAEYGEIAETNLPELHDELSNLEAKFKYDKKQLEAEISAANTKFKDLVSFAKKGIKDLPLEMDNTFRISVLNHYLFYTWINDRFELALVQEIPSHEKFDIFNSVEKNREVFEELGYALPEIEIKDDRVNLRRFSSDESDSRYEAWDDGEIIRVNHFWKEDFIDDDTEETVSVDRTNVEKYSKENYPYKDIDPYFNEPADEQEGTTDEIPEEPEE
jgi:hypothetical protein